MEVFRLFGSIGVDTRDAQEALDDVRRSGQRAGDDIQNNTGRKFSQFGKSSAVIFGAIAGAAQAAFQKIISVVSSTVSSAIKRVDTLNNSTRVFRNMGFGADEITRAMKALDKSISGLPTPLDAAVKGVQVLAATSGDLEGAQKVYKALNDGILAFGGTAEQVDGAILQLSQRPLDGPLDAETWNSLMENGLTPVLAAIAKESGMSMGKLKEAFGEGKLTVADFNDMLVKMDQEGGGGMASLEKQARDATSGISTGWSNMQTAITRGVAKIIEAIGSDNISSAISAIGKAFEGALTFISQTIDYVQEHKDVFSTMAAGIMGVVGAIAVFRAVNMAKDVMGVVSAFRTGKDAVASYQASTKAATAVQAALNAVMNANPISIIILAIAALVAALIWFFTQTETGRQIFSDFMSFLSSAWQALSSTLSGVWDAITAAVNGAISWIANFIGQSVAAIQATWNTVWGGISAFFSAVWNGMLATLQFIWNALLAFLTIAVGIPLAIINTLLLQPLLALWNIVWNAISSAFTAVWNFMVAFLTPVVDFIKNAISAALYFLSSVWSAVWNTIKTVFTTVWNAIKAFLTPIINGIKNTITTVFNAIKTTISNVFNAIKTTISTVWDTIKSIVSTAINNLKTNISNIFNAIKSTAVSIWNGIKSAIEGPINKAKDIVKKAIDAIKKFFSFRISWPKIPLPHFSIKPSGWQIGDLLKGKIPSLGVDFYAKGGILTAPTIFGLNGNRAMVGGEAGREAVLPLDRENLGMIGDGIAETMDKNDTAIMAALLEEVKLLRKENRELKVILDSGELVGAVRKKIDKALQKDATLRERGLTV